MTQFVPYVPGTPSPQRRNTAALALLETNERVVVVEQSDGNGKPGYNTSNVSGKLHGFKRTAEKAGISVHVGTERDGDIVRGYAWKVRPSVVEAPAEAKARSVALAKNPTPKVTVETVFVNVNPPKKVRSRSKKSERNAAAIERALNYRYPTVTVSSTNLVGRKDGLTRRQVQGRYYSRAQVLNRLVWEQGLPLTFSVVSTENNVRIDAKRS